MAALYDRASYLRNIGFVFTVAQCQLAIRFLPFSHIKISSSFGAHRPKYSQPFNDIGAFHGRKNALLIRQRFQGHGESLMGHGLGNCRPKSNSLFIRRRNSIARICRTAFL